MTRRSLVARLFAGGVVVASPMVVPAWWDRVKTWFARQDTFGGEHTFHGKPFTVDEFCPPNTVYWTQQLNADMIDDGRGKLALLPNNGITFFMDPQSGAVDIGAITRELKRGGEEEGLRVSKGWK